MQKEKLTKLELLNLNQFMLEKYNKRDRQQLESIMNLKCPNLWDYYLIICALCNYLEVEELAKIKAQLYNTRQIIHDKLDPNENYKHKPEDYAVQICYETTCKNLHHQNKYHLYEYEITNFDDSLVQILWAWKAKDCLKFVSKEEDRLVVSIGRDQLFGFIAMLDELSIKYDLSDIQDGLWFVNVSGNKLVDLDTLNLPFTPYDFQIEDATRLVGMKRALNGAEMGCGKTFESILVGESINMPKLVICPESLRLNWEREILNVKPEADVHILYAHEQFHTGKDWTIIGYASVAKFVDKLLELKCIFVDEAHFCKSVSNWGKPTSKRAEAVLKIADKAEYVYLLTGTPVPSHNRDLYNLLKILKCNEFDFSNTWAFKNFGMRYCDGHDTYFGMDYSGNSNSDELHQLLEPLMVRRLKKDVLPDLKLQRQFIPIKPTLSRSYKDIEKRLYENNSNDTYMGLTMSGRRILSELKLPTVIDFAESILDSDQSVVIVTNFVNTADMLQDHFGTNACAIRGGMGDEAKQQAIDDFQAGKCKVCIMNMQAGGVGITLTKAHVMIMMDFDFVPAVNRQAEDRICRVGQTEMCNVYYIYCVNSIFDKIFVKMLSDKSDNIATVVDDEESDYNLEEARDNNASYLYELKKELAESKKK